MLFISNIEPGQTETNFSIFNRTCRRSKTDLHITPLFAVSKLNIFFCVFVRMRVDFNLKKIVNSSYLFKDFFSLLKLYFLRLFCRKNWVIICSLVYSTVLCTYILYKINLFESIILAHFISQNYHLAACILRVWCLPKKIINATNRAHNSTERKKKTILNKNDWHRIRHFKKNSNIIDQCYSHQIAY